MVFGEQRQSNPDTGSSGAIWKRRMAKIQRRLRAAEDSLEQAASDFYQFLDEFETGEAHVPQRGTNGARVAVPLPFATGFVIDGPSEVAFVVHGVEFRASLSPFRMDLLALLRLSPKDEGGDDLVGFKTVGKLVHALRARGWDATSHSVTVEISRLRAAFGATNRHLIETRRGCGYRFRLLRSVTTSDRRAAA
jgi:hypothetical protein